MKTLTIFFDARCGLCCRFSRWLMTQPARVSIQFLPYDSDEALRLFPRMMEVHADREIVVLADDGRWWQGTGAWLTCLWATREYRDWSFRLASPALRPWVSKAVSLLSGNRLKLSELLRLRSEAEMATALASIAAPACDSGSCGLPPRLPRVSFPEPITFSKP